jgi:hypothetical protein
MGQFGNAATVTGMELGLLCLPVEWAKIGMEWGKLLEKALASLLRVRSHCSHSRRFIFPIMLKLGPRHSSSG